jgi:integrase
MVSDWLEALTEAKQKRSRIDYARRLLTAALSWEVSQGRMVINPAAQIRIPTSKARRAREQVSDTVFLPTWKELADLINAIDDEETRLLVAVMAWTGLRWSEAVSLEAQDVWKDRSLITVRRVLVKSSDGWVVEAPKGGRVESVPLPSPLWRRLRELAIKRTRQRALPKPAGKLLFRTEHLSGGIGVLDNTNFRRRIWNPAIAEADLLGDASRPKNDPRHKAIRPKDLRAFAASILVDAGASMTEAALLLRHSDQRTTEQHYARAVREREQDPARMSIRLKKNLTMYERIEALWVAWAKGFPEAVDNLGIPKDSAKDSANRGRKLRAV